MNDIILCAEGLKKNFGPVQALVDAQLRLRAGEIHALMGENGAGKSTLIKVLTGIHAPCAGRVTLHGKAIYVRSPREAESAGISTVYQEVNLIPELSVADNILLGRQPKRFGFLRKGLMRERANAALARLGIKLDVSLALSAYPIAIQQLVAIARAMDIQARVLILDEPTSSLDAKEVHFLFETLRRLRDQGLAILLVTHFLDQVYAISDRITVLRNGTFVGEFETAALPRLKLISAMIGREIDTLKQCEPAKVGEPSKNEAVVLSAQKLGRKDWIPSIDVEMCRGEVLGLSGLLGSGRTEIAKMFYGAAPADTGQLFVDGECAKIDRPREAIQRGLAFCSEDRRTEGILPHLSVRENIILALQASRGPARLIPLAEQRSLVRHYIQVLNIKTPSPETPIANLSGGNQQKVLLARCLALQPRIILLDEPTRGIDVGAKAEIEKWVHSLREKGLSVLYISSDLEELARMCQRVVVLKDRRKVGELEGSDVQPDQIMRMIANASN